MGTDRPLDAADTASLENTASLALTAFCWWRADIPQDVCETYRRDVHGIMFAARRLDQPRWPQSAS